jgi:hypothetical protein
MRWACAVAIGFCFCPAFPAATSPTLSECLAGLANAAATFSATAPGLNATETLDQRGRRGTIDLLKKATPGDLKKSTIRLDETFRAHQVVSSWSLTPAGEDRAIHETRRITAVDGKVFTAAPEARHALTIGMVSDDDHTKRALLEDFEQDALEGAVIDFSQILLLFEARRQTDYDFSRQRMDMIGDDAVTVISYRQVSGDEGLTTFHDRIEARLTVHGEIWLRASDLLPLRITMSSEEKLSSRYTVKTEAQVDYAPSLYWLVPAAVTHRQFLNADLVMENDFHYADYHRANRMIP